MPKPAKVTELYPINLVLDHTSEDVRPGKFKLEKIVIEPMMTNWSYYLGGGEVVVILFVIAILIIAIYKLGSYIGR